MAYRMFLVRNFVSSLLCTEKSKNPKTLKPR